MCDVQGHVNAAPVTVRDHMNPAVCRDLDDPSAAGLGISAETQWRSPQGRSRHNTVGGEVASSSSPSSRPLGGELAQRHLRFAERSARPTIRLMPGQDGRSISAQ
jgi:hypothetical protein